jgi:DNA-binding CsgD family transcriptional regulator
LARRAGVLHRFESLTPREKQVMELVVDGAANKVIAIDLGLSERTVEIHRANVMEKMGARSVAHLVKMHLKLGGELRFPQGHTWIHVFNEQWRAPILTHLSPSDCRHDYASDSNI